MALLAAVLVVSFSVAVLSLVRTTVEQELDHRLEAVGETAVTLLGPSLVPGLLALTPAHEGFRLYQDRRRVLTDLQERTGVRRIFLADLDGRSFVDTDARIGIATPLAQLRSDLPEMQKVRNGRPTAGPIIPTSDRGMQKTGYVPVTQGGQVIALVGVEADATFLAAANRVRTRLLWIGALGLLLSLGLAALVARGLTRPISNLVRWSESVGRGGLDQPAPAGGGGEIGVLGRTLERMRIEIEARDREQRTMVAGVAHELRNPLAGVKLYSDLLAQDDTLGDGARTRLATIRRELDHLDAVIDQFLSYARPTAAAPEAVAVDPLLRELADWVRVQADAKGVQVKVEAPSTSTGTRVWVDPTQLRQMLHNLLRNAIEATPASGSVALSVENSAELAAIDVADEGPGLSGEVVGRVFEPFFTTKKAGAGLGLAIVQRLALLNHGRVEAANRPGGGARFRLSLPLAVVGQDSI